MVYFKMQTSVQSMVKELQLCQWTSILHIVSMIKLVFTTADDDPEHSHIIQAEIYLKDICNKCIGYIRLCASILTS